jgi:hypothetical protein
MENNPGSTLYEMVDKSSIFDTKKKYKNPIKSVNEYNHMLKDIKQDTNNLREDVIEQYIYLI